MIKFASLALPALLLAACVTPNGHTASLTADDLIGSEWRFVVIDGEAPKSDRAQLAFAADRLSMSAGCNGMGGSWKLASGRIDGGPYMSTMMYCEGLMEQERALASLLEEKPVAVLTGDELVLTSASHSATLRRAAP